MPRKRENNQSKLFIEKAREIGCEEDADEEEIMRKLAGQKKQGRPKTATKSKVIESPRSRNGNDR